MIDAMFAATRGLVTRSALVGAAVGSFLILRPAALPAAGDTVPPAPSDNQVMVSISAPTQVPPEDTASVGTAVHEVQDGDPVGGITIVLDHRAAGTETWSEAGHAVTDSKGRAVFVSSIPVSTDFRTRAMPDQRHPAASSATVTVQATS
ncbi:MAG TPA: hypothetical protein VE081_10755 [Sporichthyaceae bacterium]|nr:hypothetical protein [Sporichthyaceae bacterium]